MIAQCLIYLAHSLTKFSLLPCILIEDMSAVRNCQNRCYLKELPSDNPMYPVMTSIKIVLSCLLHFQSSRNSEKQLVQHIAQRKPLRQKQDQTHWNMKLLPAPSPSQLSLHNKYGALKVEGEGSENAEETPSGGLPKANHSPPCIRTCTF